jgi:hypothetical protein
MYHNRPTVADIRVMKARCGRQLFRSGLSAVAIRTLAVLNAAYVSATESRVVAL